MNETTTESGTEASPEPEELDLETEAGVLRLCEIVREEMAAQFLKDGELTPYINAFVLATCQMPEFNAGAKLTPGPKLPQIEPVPCPLREGGPLSVMAQVYAARTGRTDVEQIEKNMWAHTVKQLIKGTRASGVVFTSEAWYMNSQGIEPRPEGRWFEGQVKDQPDRLEGLMCSLEHEAFAGKFWRAQILRDPLRLEPWELLELDATEGRFTNLLKGRDDP